MIRMGRMFETRCSHVIRGILAGYPSYPVGALCLLVVHMMIVLHLGRSHIEPEQDHIPILHHIFLPLGPHQPFFLGGGIGLAV